MKSECYLLHIYCDAGENCVNKYENDVWNEEYTGRNRREAIHSAKKGGWIVGKIDYCPMCVQAARKNDEKDAND